VTREPALETPTPRASTHESRELVALRHQLVVGDEIASLPRPEALIEDVLDLNSVGLLFGRSGSGKSFVALDWALCISTAIWWKGHRIQPGPVLYVAGEGAVGLGARLEAWKRFHDVQGTGPISWIPGAVDLLDRRCVDALATVADEVAPALVVIDTLSRCMAGGDENSPKDMTTVIRALDTIRDVTGACVLPVHHTGKDPTAGARGHSALRAALDTEIRVEGGDRIITLHADKQRHHVDGHVITKLELTQVGSSCALGEYRGGPPDAGTLRTSDRAALEALNRIATDDGVPTSRWQRATDLAERTFYEARKRLVDRGQVANVGSKQRPLYVPTATATATAE
jgi:AAA domain